MHAHFLLHNLDNESNYVCTFNACGKKSSRLLYFDRHVRRYHPQMPANTIELNVNPFHSNLLTPSTPSSEPSTSAGTNSDPFHLPTPSTPSTTPSTSGSDPFHALTLTSTPSCSQEMEWNGNRDLMPETKLALSEFISSIDDPFFEVNTNHKLIKKLVDKKVLAKPVEYVMYMYMCGANVQCGNYWHFITDQISNEVIF